jgi:hypothetical protein
MNGNYQLFVEGQDDVHVLVHPLKHHEILQRIKIEDKRGIENLLEILPTELRVNSELERLGIVVDADEDIDARWMALRDRLIKSGSVQMPTAPDPEGTVVTIEQPDRVLIVGIWLMPNNILPGMLENFVSFLVPKDDSLWNRAAACLEQIPEQERRFPANHQIKAHIHTWLAWQEEPGKPLGQAITKRYLDAETSHAQQFMNWIRRLFGL